MKFILKYWVFLMAGISILLFLWLRFNFIGTSFDFTGDPGRDMLVLWDWRESGKPPLLGPQTSAMPINQSAVYFYMLYPAFLIMNGDPISANITVAVFWIVSLLIGLWVLRKRPDLQWVSLIVFALSSIHPIFVSQTREVWNPSFLPPLITIGIISLYLLKEKFTYKRLWMFALSMSLAVSLHFPVGALAVACLIYVAIFFKEKRFLVLIALIMAILFFNLPTIAFEVRHDFLITKSTLSGNWIGTEQFTRIDNLNMLIKFSGGLSGWWANVLLFLGLGFFAIQKMLLKNDSLTKMVGLLMILFVAITIASKMAFHSHYAFGFAVLLFFLISQLPTKIFLSVLLLLEIVWLNPSQTDKYFSPARRPIEEMSNCFEKICSSEADPLFVSVQSGVSPFHVGYEFRYLMKKAGCQVRYIEREPTAATKMAVVVDSSSYEHRKTGFEELTIFGDSEVSAQYTCSKDFGVVVLKRN